MIKYVSRNKDEAVVMTIIHIGKRGRGRNIGRKCKNKSVALAHMWSRTAVHVILILKQDPSWPIILRDLVETLHL